MTQTYSGSSSVLVVFCLNFMCLAWLTTAQRKPYKASCLHLGNSVNCRTVKKMIIFYWITEIKCLKSSFSFLFDIPPRSFLLLIPSCFSHITSFSIMQAAHCFSHKYQPNKQADFLTELQALVLGLRSLKIWVSDMFRKKLRHPALNSGKLYSQYRKKNKMKMPYLSFERILSYILQIVFYGKKK